MLSHLIGAQINGVREGRRWELFLFLGFLRRSKGEDSELSSFSLFYSHERQRRGGTGIIHPASPAHSASQQTERRWHQTLPLYGITDTRARHHNGRTAETAWAAEQNGAETRLLSSGLTRAALDQSAIENATGSCTSSLVCSLQQAGPHALS
jgi:hypothetical protein